MPARRRTARGLGARTASAILGCLAAGAAVALEIDGLAQISAVDADRQTGFINSGTGVLRYDDDGIQLQQAVLRLRQDLGSAFSAELTANLYADGDLKLGLTQAMIRWKPLSAGKVRTRGRAGFFYPRMSAENVDIGWLSPYSYTPSAINSWLGEELRVFGIEGSLFSPGRARRSPWSWELTGALFGGNDPLGSVLSWRGFATHDRQSLHHDRLQFAPYPTVVGKGMIYGPAWVEPFHEIDGRPGGYAGLHLRHSRGLDLRLYHYDNNADPREVNGQRLYAWDTRFSSLALSYDLGADTRLLAQWMGGQTEMGSELVGADFDSAYLMLSRRWGDHRFSARYDWWDVTEDDRYPRDINDSDGDAYTLAWRYTLDERWQLGLEYVRNANSAANRVTLNEPVSVTQQQLLAVLQYRLGR